MSNVYLWIAGLGIVVFLCVGSFFYGAHVGAQGQIVAQQKQDLKTEQKVIIQEKIQTVVDTKAVAELQAQLDALNTQNTNLQAQIKAAKKLTVIVPATTTTPAVCKLGPDWVSAYNTSLQ